MSSIACSITPAWNKASRFSFTAFTLPGSVVIKVFLIVPATGLESAAKGVCLRDEEIMRWTRPGAGRSMSGVMAWILETFNCVEQRREEY